jgi:hypothetical protein
MPKYHLTVGVYPNGEYKTNGVSPENLAAHVEYNKGYRPGRGLMVDGKFVHNGCVDEEMRRAFVMKFAGITADRDTQPYH